MNHLEEYRLMMEEVEVRGFQWVEVEVAHCYHYRKEMVKRVKMGFLGTVVYLEILDLALKECNGRFRNLGAKS